MEELRKFRMGLIALVAVVATMTSCAANDTYQMRVFKEAALAKGMTAAEVSCAWGGDGHRNSPMCVLLAKEGK